MTQTTKTRIRLKAVFLGVILLLILVYPGSTRQLPRQAGITSPTAANLYHITLTDDDNAAAFRTVQLEPLLRVGNEYLALGTGVAAEQLRRLGVAVSLLVESIDTSELAIDHRRDRKNIDRFTLRKEYLDPVALDIWGMWIEPTALRGQLRRP